MTEEEQKALAECEEARAADARNSGYEEGYVEALKDFGIWRNGVQYIGCLETPIKDIIKKKFGRS